MLKNLVTLEEIARSTVEGEGKHRIKQDPRFFQANIDEINYKTGLNINTNSESAHWRWLREKVGDFTKKQDFN